MNKSMVDEIMAEYVPKIFGFAFSKLTNTDKAEELASRITYDVYVSLLNASDIYNIAGYVYRVACNVYARFVDEETRERYYSLDNLNISSTCNFTTDVENNELYRFLRQKISYLSKTRREIVVSHYFDRLKQMEIAAKLGLPLGYLVQENSGEYVNMVVVKGDKKYWNGILPAMPEEFKAVSKEMGSKRYAIEIQGVPTHLHDFHRLPTDNNSLCCQDFITHVLTKLLTAGVLKLPTEAQKKSLNTIMVCDVLPIF